MKNKTATFLMGVGLILVISGILGKFEIGLLVGWVMGYILLSGVENERAEDTGISEKTE
jgi:hypothetical protein